MQSRSIVSEDTRRAFEDSQDRIHSMALLHEMLCRSGNLAKIDLGEYARHLVEHLTRSYGVDQESIRLSTHLDPVSLDLDAAVPFGLILNELVSNTLRHGFPDGARGEMEIELKEQPDNQIRLTVRDNGVGLESEAGWQKPGSLGFRLVRMLAEQLGGNVDVRPRDPTEFRITFTTR